jgi:hypothetical protein
MAALFSARRTRKSRTSSRGTLSRTDDIRVMGATPILFLRVWFFKRNGEKRISLLMVHLQTVRC